MSSVNNKIIFTGNKQNIENLMGYLIKMSMCKTYSSDEDTREMVRIDSDVDVNITNLDTISGGLELELDFDSQLSPADVLLSEIVKLFPDVEINGEYKFHDEDESYSWKGELGLWLYIQKIKSWKKRLLN